MKISALIVDDEALARARIRKLLEDAPDITLLGECSSGEEAVSAIRREQPDLLFLDVQMPKVNGFDVLRALEPDRIPVTIFITAFDSHALEAFEAQALDYLLKPFRESRFRQALDRARAQLKKDAAARASDKLLNLLGNSSTLSRVAVKTPDKIVFLKAEEIDWIESAGNYVILHVKNESHILRETLTKLEQQLAPNQFIRVSRSCLANVERIQEIQQITQREYVMILKSGARLAVTRSVRELQQQLRFSGSTGARLW